MPERQLTTRLPLSFHQTCKLCKLLALAQNRTVLFAEAEDIAVESVLKVTEQVNERRTICHDLKELRRSASETGEVVVLEHFPCLKIGNQ